MPTLRRDDVELWYQEEGTGGPPLLLVHGFCGDHTDMGPLFDHFRATHRVVTVDRRGHGHSDKPEQRYTIEGFADDLVWLSDQLGLHRPVVVQHSMDKIALDLAARYPDRLSAVVILDGPSFPPAEVEAAFAQVLDGLRSPAYQQVLTQLADQLVFAPTDDPVRKAAIVERMTSLPQHVISSTWEEYLAHDAVAAAAACRVPTQYIGGVFPRDLDRFRALVPQLVTGQVTGTGHFVMLEAPDQVIALMEPFLTAALQPVA